MPAWPIWAFFLATGAGGVVLAVWALCGDRAGDRVRCPRCFYDLAGLTGQLPIACPECAAEIVRERQLRRTRRRWGRMALGLLIVLISAGSLLGERIWRSGWAAVTPDRVLIELAPRLPADWRAAEPVADEVKRRIDAHQLSESAERRLAELSLSAVSRGGDEAAISRSLNLLFALSMRQQYRAPSWAPERPRHYHTTPGYDGLARYLDPEAADALWPLVEHTNSRIGSYAERLIWSLADRDPWLLPPLISRQVSRAIAADDPKPLRFGSTGLPEQRPGATYVAPLDYQLLDWRDVADNWKDDPRIELLQSIRDLHPNRDSILDLLRQRCVENNRAGAIALWLLARLDPHAPETRTLIVAEARRCFGLQPDQRPPEEIPAGFHSWAVERHPHAQQVTWLLGIFPVNDEIVSLAGAALASDGLSSGFRALSMLESRRDLAAKLHEPILARIGNPSGWWTTRTVPFALEIGIPKADVRAAVHEAARRGRRSRLHFLDLAQLGGPDPIGAQLARQALEEGMTELSRGSNLPLPLMLLSRRADVLQIARELEYVLPGLATCEANPAACYQGLLTLRQIVEDRHTPEFLDGVEPHRLGLTVDTGLRYGLIDPDSIKALLHAPSSRWLLQDLKAIERYPAGLTALLPDLDELSRSPDLAIATGAADAARAVRGHRGN